MGDQLQANKDRINMRRSEFLERLKVKQMGIFGASHADEERHFNGPSKDRRRRGGFVWLPRPPGGEDN